MIDSLEKGLILQTRLIDVSIINFEKKLFGIFLKKHDYFQPIKPNNDETKVFVDAKLLIDTDEIFETKLTKKQVIEKKKETILEAVKLVEEQRMIQRNME